MAWSKSTKQRRAMVRRRGRNGDHKRRFLERVSAKIDKAQRRMDVIAWEGLTVADVARWLR